MRSTVPYRRLWSVHHLTAGDLQALLSTAALLKQGKQQDAAWSPLRGRHIALLCSGRNGTPGGFERAVTELGGTASLLNADDWRQSACGHEPDAARLLGRLYDAIDCCDLPPGVVEEIEAHSGAPVFNGLAASNPLVPLVGALLTIRDTAHKPLEQSRLYVPRRNGNADAAASLDLLRLAGIRIVPSPAPMPEHPGGTAHTANGRPDFILETDAASADCRLSKPNASAAQQADLDERLAANRQLALQAALVCGLQ